MLNAMMVPEVVTCVASGQWSSARRSVLAMAQPKKWTMRHAFYADMGGFRLRERSGKEYLTRAWHINYLVKHEYIDIPTITVEEIKDKSKSDSFTKTLACLQIAWLAAQCIGRATQGLPVTTLEIATLCFVPPTVATFCLWLHKPFDVGISTVIRLDCDVAEINVEELLPAYMEAHPTWVQFTADGKPRMPLEVIDDGRPNWTVDVTPWFRFWRHGKPPQEDRIRNDRLPANGLGMTIVVSVVSFVYGGLHVLAWNVEFPTRTELILWRVISLSLVGSILAWWMLDVSQTLWERFSHAEKIATPAWRMALSIPVAVIYGGTRAYLMIEAFVALRTLPEAAYKTVQWSAFLPHIGI